MKTNKTLGSKRSNILTLAGILSLSIVSYSNCSQFLKITNSLQLPAKASLHYSTCRVFPSDQNLLVKPGQTITINIGGCSIGKVSAMIDVLNNNTWSVAAVPYTSPHQVGDRGNFRIVKDAKYSANGGFGIEKRQ